jgi:ABC-2 type transport system permease protein
MVIEVSQGQQLAGQLNLLFMMPWFFTPLFLAGAQSPLILAFTFIPFTSFLTVIMRWSLGTVPFWQLSVSWLLLVSSAVFSLWLATRVFRLGMLRYGKRLSLKSVWNAIRRGVKVDLREVESHV